MTASTPNPDLVPVDRLAPRLVEATGDPRWSSFRVTMIAGGKSNLTYLLTGAAGELILRRPPSGTLLPTAHDMGREVRVQQALASTPVPVAPVVLAETTPATIGVPFYVMERMDGQVIRDRIPPHYAERPEDRAKIADALIDALIRIHAVDPNLVGLSDFGRPAGFLDRQVRRWTAQSTSSRSTPVPALDELGERLGRSVPRSARTGIVHGDFRLDNCLMHPDDPGRVSAVLDWELSTLGDPLTDLGLLLLYWPEAGEQGIPLVPTVTGQGGFPGRAHLVDRYAAGTGADLTEIAWYRAFAQFKFAVIIQGVQARADAGAMGGQAFDRVDDGVLRLAETGLNLLEAS